MTTQEDVYRNPTPDPYSWQLDVVDAPAGTDPAMRVFNASTDPMNEGRSPARVVCRGEALAVYARTFGDGKGEIPIHSHDDESCWYVVKGGARFFDSANEEIANLTTGDGIFIPAGARYRFACVGDETMLMRIASKLPNDHN